MYKEVFYWFNYYISKYVKFNKEPNESAYFMTCIWMLFNIYLLYAVVNCLTISSLSFNIPLLSKENRYDIRALSLILVFVSPILIGNYFYLYRKKRREKIFSYYENLNKKRKTRGKIFFWLYIIMSFYLLFFVLYQKNKDDDVALPIKQELIFEKFSPPAEPIKLY